MNWAQYAIEKLNKGEIAELTPHGNSMIPLIYSGETVVLCPILSEIEVGDIVLAKVRGNVILHIVKAIHPDKGYLIANRKGRENGWTHIIYGRFVKKL